MIIKKMTQRHGFETSEVPASSCTPPRREPDRLDPRAGVRLRQAGAVRHQFHQGQDDVASSARKDHVSWHAQAGRAAERQLYEAALDRLLREQRSRD